MRLVKGHRLDAGVREEPLAGRLRLFLRICEAVAYAHAHGVVHRDLKPENVMVGPFGEVLVMDWGVAKVLAGPLPEAASPLPEEARPAAVSAPSAADAPGTAHGTVLGTPGSGVVFGLLVGLFFAFLALRPHPPQPQIIAEP